MNKFCEVEYFFTLNFIFYLLHLISTQILSKDAYHMPIINIIHIYNLHTALDRVIGRSSSYINFINEFSPGFDFQNLFDIKF
jgi:hypothetical protein